MSGVILKIKNKIKNTFSIEKPRLANTVRKLFVHIGCFIHILACMGVCNMWQLTCWYNIHKVYLVMC